MTTDFMKTHCMVCAKEGAFEGGICDLCKAKIRGEALEGQHQLKKEADKSLHKEGLVIEKKGHG
jgi:predicted amidophosphoribosyltransferase